MDEVSFGWQLQGIPNRILKPSSLRKRATPQQVRGGFGLLIT